MSIKNSAKKEVATRRGWSRKLLATVLMTVAGTGPAFSEGSTGTVSILHLNADVSGRGACIQMQPALTGTGWACLYLDNPLYKEFNAVLLSAYAMQKSCEIAWYTEDAEGHKVIRSISCSGT